MSGSLFRDPRRTRMPLYEPGKVFPNGVEHVTGMPRDPGCRRCPLAIAAKHPCLVGVEGKPGDVLVVAPRPTQHDDIAGKLVDEGVSGIVRKAVEAGLMPGSGYRLVYATSCPGPADERAIQACRPYLSAEFAMGPSRALVFGEDAATAVLGVPVNGASIRRARAHVRGVPTFLLMDPRRAASNRVLWRWFNDDVTWALRTGDVDPIAGEVRVADTPADALALLGEIVPHRPLDVDVEHAGTLWNKEFRILCVGLCQDVERPFVLPADVMEPAVVAELRRVMEDPAIPKVNQWIKIERHALWRAWGIEIEGIVWDTLLVGKLLESDAPAGLDAYSWKVGMGGYKKLGQAGAEDE